MDISKLLAKPKNEDAVSALILGEAGVGKTLLTIRGAKNPYLLDLEGGAKRYHHENPDLKRIDCTILNWIQINAITDALIKEAEDMRTLIIDSGDYLAQKLADHLIEDVYKMDIVKDTFNSVGRGYGHALDVQAQIFREFVKKLTKALSKGVCVVVICHTEIKRITKINAAERDRLEPRLHKKLIPILTEWAEFIGALDLLETAEGSQTKTSGDRVLYVDATGAAICKNRFGLKEPMINPTWGSILKAIQGDK